MFIRYSCYILLCISFFISCSPDNEGREDLIGSTEFYPLNIGHSVAYQIDEIVLRNGGNQVDTFSYQLKEEIVSQFMSNDDEEIFTIDRFTRNRTSEPWSYANSWQVLLKNNQLIRIEDNTRFIKLRLPIRQDDTWDGNALFDASLTIIIGDDPIQYYDNWQSKIIGTGQTETIGEQRLDGIMTISLADHENRLNIRKGVEKYALNIGLVYREFEIFDTQCFDLCEDESWIEKGERGHYFVQKIISE